MERMERQASAGPRGWAGDWARFFGAWMRHPVKMGAVAPSSPSYCAAMVDHATVGLDGPVLELGAGLGVVTRALIEKGVDPERITSIEYDAGFARTLQGRFRGVNVVCGDGFDLDRTLGAQAGETFAAILLAIPITHFPQGRRQAYLRDLLSRLRPGGNVTQLSYMWTAPVKPVPGLFAVSASPVVWDNIPPAKVWIYTPLAPSSAEAGSVSAP